MVGDEFWVANHGDGRILSYDRQWQYLGKIHLETSQNPKGDCVPLGHGGTPSPQSIDGLYGLRYHKNYVYFSSAPNGGISGLIGKIKHHSCVKHHHHSNQCEDGSSTS
jgi:hypothetical protein